MRNARRSAKRSHNTNNDNYSRNIKRRAEGDADRIYLKPVLISIISAVILGLIVVGIYYLLNARIGTSDLFKRNEFKITTSEENEQIFPLTFKMKNLEGDEISAADEHKPVIISFFASWNNYSVKQIAELEELKADNPDIRVIYINLNEKEENIDAILKENNFDIAKSDIVIDKKEKIYKAVGSSELPVTLFVNVNGTIAEFSEKRIYKDEMQEIADEMIKKAEYDVTPEPEDEDTNDGSADE